MALNDLVDPATGVDWNGAANQLFNLRQANTPISAVQPIPYFEHLFPTFPSLLGGGLSATQTAYAIVARKSVGGFNTPDWTNLQNLLNDFFVRRSAGVLPTSVWITLGIFNDQQFHVSRSDSDVASTTERPVDP